MSEKLIAADAVKITWYFESERELIDIVSLKTLLKATYVHLHIPYLPYARQDKIIDNNSTFNLEVLAFILNSLKLSKVTSVDVHNALRTRQALHNFQNIRVEPIIDQLLQSFDAAVFPDYGASNRYSLHSNKPKVAFEKIRNQDSGLITGVGLIAFYSRDPVADIRNAKKVLMVDDLADGGATFIKVAEQIRTINPSAHIGLYVTHGVFSKGRQHLLDNGIDSIYTTNTLGKNQSDIRVEDYE